MPRFSTRSNLAHLIRWREWGHEAFREAAQQNRPLALFLVGWWCGFCQRMDERALSDPDAIALLNAFFIPVRVEESHRPDVDLRYNHNGWPTISFLSPAGDYLFSVNYMDPDPFIDLLVHIVQQHQQDNLPSATPQAAPSPQPPQSPPTRQPSAEVLYEIIGMLEALADHTHGGFGHGFKFLHTEANDLFLHLHHATGQPQYLDHVTLTLDQLHGSPTFDAHLGGYFRYSSNPTWIEPHREKFLADQAGILRNLLDVYQFTGHERFKTCALDLLSFIDTQLADPHTGMFAGCQDYVSLDGPPAPGASHPPHVPALDQTIYCDANALTASAYLRAWQVLGLDDCRQRATTVLENLWEKMRANGEMYHYWSGVPGHHPQAPGLLADTVETGLALLDAAIPLDDPTLFQRASQLGDAVLAWPRLPDGSLADVT